MTAKARMEGLSLTVSDIAQSIEFYKKLGFEVEVTAPPDFALLRIGGQEGGTIGLLTSTLYRGLTNRFEHKAIPKEWTPANQAAVHLEFGTDDVDALYKELKEKGITFHAPPHKDPWEKVMQTYDPDGYVIEISEGRRGRHGWEGPVDENSFKEARKKARKRTA